MRIYIAGPMTGLPEFNFPAFNRAEEHLVSKGFEVINPARLADHTHKEWEWYMRNSLEVMVRECDSIALLNGWSDSCGANIEAFVAGQLGFSFYEEIDGGFIEPSSLFNIARELNVDVLFEKLGGSMEDWLNKQSILGEAQILVHGDRQSDYGHPYHDFSRTAQMWSAILGQEITPAQVGLCMIAVKVSRECHKPKRDNLVDIAGYAETVRMVREYES